MPCGPDTINASWARRAMGWVPHGLAHEFQRKQSTKGSPANKKDLHTCPGARMPRLSTTASS
eukprot:122349-Chlamydomonas_euryale.AAC.1